ncbi:MAG: hypothetical protein Q8L47_04900, partial [bacterium]|nr:hypothetical protein [bacterium]
MKKQFIIFSILLILFSGLEITKAKTNTKNYIKERFAVYSYIPDKADIDYWSKTSRNHIGTLEENLTQRISNHYKYGEELLAKGMPKEVTFNENTLGAIPKRPTEFKTNLATQLTEGHSGTTLKVTSITTKDDNTLDASVLGDLIVLSINSGSSNSETVVCTGLTTATKTFTGCVFGYRFDNPTETQSANVKAHSPGEPIIISNPDTYLSQQYVTIDGDTIILGKFTIASSTAPLSNRLYLSSTTPAYLEANAGILYYCNNGASCAAIGAGANTYSFVTPLGVSGSEVSIATSTNEFDLDGSNNLSIKFNNSLTSNSSGVAVNTTTDYLWTGNATSSGSVVFSGDATHTGSTTFEKIPTGIVTIGDGSDGAFTATSTSRLDPNKIWEFTSLTVGSGTTLSHEASSTILHIRVNGNCSIAGIIDLSGKGAAGGTGGATNSGEGTDGSSANEFRVASSSPQYGLAGTGAAGTGGVITAAKLWYADMTRGLKLVYPGSGGGGGDGGSGVSGGVGG